MERLFTKGANLETTEKPGASRSDAASRPASASEAFGETGDTSATNAPTGPGMAEPVCTACDGMGMRVVKNGDGRFLARPCECREERREFELVRRSRIPERYMQCTLENYDFRYPGADPSLYHAHLKASGFVRNYPHRQQGVGLLFTGSVGTGKTHLAVGILRAILLSKLKRGESALFCDHRGLLKAVNNSYNPRAGITELEVLEPVFEAEVLVIDELGSAKKTEWVSDIVEHILNTRYNDHRTTIITTNYPNRAAGRFLVEPEVRNSEGSAHAPVPSFAPDPSLSPMDRHILHMEKRKAEGFAPLSVPAAAGPEKSPFGSAKLPPRKSMGVMSEETLGERIGARMLSRLAEMCVTVELKGADYRLSGKKARFE